MTSAPAYKTARLLLLAAITGGAAFVFGALAEQVDGSASRFWLYLALLLAGIALSTGLTLRLLLGGVRSPAIETGVAVGSILLGAILFGTYLMVFVAGVLIRFLAGWGGQELEAFGDSDLAPEEWAPALFYGAAITGGIFGSFVGFLSWASRFIPASVAPGR